MNLQDNKIERVLLAGLSAAEARAKGNYILLAKELFIETDNYKMKLGDGKTAYNRLSYLPYSTITTDNISNWNQAVIDGRNNRLPSQVGHAGEFLTTDGTNLSWAGVAGGGITSLNGLAGAVQTFSKVDDTNVTLTITSALANHAFTLGWTGTLADARIASAATWNAKQNAITTGTTLQYFRGDLSLATFPTNVSSFTNDSGYLTSATIPLTANRIAFGSATNFMTSNANFTYNPTSAFSTTVTSGTDIISLNLNGGGGEIGYATTANTYSFLTTAPTHAILAYSNLTTVINTGFHASDRAATMGITNLAGNNTIFGVDDIAQTYTFNKLAGVGTRMATIDASGILGVQAIPTGYITSEGNTATINLSVALGVLTANFASMNISQFTNNSGYLTSTGITPAALSKTDDTNVTLTLGGTPATALLQATSITVGWTGTLADARLSTTAVTPASYGSATQVATFTVSATGRLTAAGNTTITPAASSITGGAALTKTDDTNVTLTLGGTPASALLAASSLTLGWTGTLDITRGGTGASTLLQARINLGTADVIKSADQTTAAGVDTTITELTIVTAANESWSFECLLVGQVSGAGGAGFTVVYSVAPNSSTIRQFVNTTGIGAHQSLISLNTTPPITGTMWSAATTEFGNHIIGSFTNGGSANTVTFKVKPINAAQTATIRKNSYVTARRVN